MSAILCALLLAVVDPYDQSTVPIEVDTTNPKLAKIVLVAGTPSHPPGAHEYLATQAVLKGLLDQTPGVFVTIVRDSWPRNPRIFAGARAIVWYTDGAKNHPLLQPEKFQTIPDPVRRQIEAATPEQLERAILQIVHIQAPQELRFD